MYTETEPMDGLERSIAKMTDAIAGILHGSLHSVWLYGSVVLDDFRLGWSDIDLLVLTESPLTDGQAHRLLTLRQAMADAEPGNPFYRLFEGIVTDRAVWRTGAAAVQVYWGTTGQRITDRVQPDTFSMFELAKYGRSVYGAQDRSLFQVPTHEEMAAAVRGHYDTIRRYAVQTNESLYACGWLLDIARCIYTLRYNDVIAKTRAGQWALSERLFEEEEPLRKTLEIRQHPAIYRQRDDDVKRWLKGLGPVVQRYADVLERELDRQRFDDARRHGTRTACVSDLSADT